MTLKVLEKCIQFSRTLKVLKTEYGLECFGICFKRSSKVLDFHCFIIIVTTMSAVSA